jgi:hypothetical protein
VKKYSHPSKASIIKELQGTTHIMEAMHIYDKQYQTTSNQKKFNVKKSKQVLKPLSTKNQNKQVMSIISGSPVSRFESNKILNSSKKNDRKSVPDNAF